MTAAPLYRKALGLDATLTRETLEKLRARVIADTDLTRAICVLDASGKLDRQTAATLAIAQKSQTVGIRNAALAEALLTKEGEPRADSRFVAKAVREKEPVLTDVLCRARDAFVGLTHDLRTIELIDATLALATLADAVMQRYSDAKNRRAALDFDDLIRKASSLLGRATSGDAPSVAEWVLYKLDGGLDHILVDEAQDTSRAQWAVVEAIAEEFFAGSGARDDDPHHVRRRRRKAVDLRLPGCRTEDVRRYG